MLLVTTSEHCVECMSNLPTGTKSEIITCVVTVITGLIIRAIEKRRDKKNESK